MYRMMMCIIGFVGIVACAKQVPTETSASPIIEKPTIEDLESLMSQQALSL